MRRTPSVFVSYTPHFTRRYLPSSISEGSRLGSHFVRQMPIRPGTHVLGLGNTPEKYDPRPVALPSLRAPLRAGSYLGFVEETNEDIVIATLWETPNGREFLVELARGRGTWSGEPSPAQGDRLKVHTWTELDETTDGALPHEHMRIEVLRAPLTDHVLRSVDEAIRIMEQTIDGRIEDTKAKR